MRFFPRPAVGSADLRHWVWQISQQVTPGRRATPASGVVRWKDSVNATPAFLEVKAGGKIVAFIVMWYDNIMVIADSTPRRDKSIAKINANAREIGAVFKISQGTQWVPTTGGANTWGLSLGQKVV
jgi:hypothetical protein